MVGGAMIVRGQFADVAPPGRDPEPGAWPVDAALRIAKPPEADPRAAAEQAVARSIGRLIDQTSQPFLCIDLDGRFLRVNHAFERLIGYAAEELRGLTTREISPDRWHDQTRRMLDRLRSTGQPQRYEKEYRRKDGKLAPVEVVIDLLRDEGGEPRGFYAFLTDLNERKCAERLVRESEERFRRLYDEAPFGYHEVDNEGIILSVNRTECEWLGYMRHEMVGRPVFDFMREDARDRARRNVVRRLTLEQEVQAVERVFLTKDGREIAFAVESRLTRDDAGEAVGLRSTLRDVTAEKRVQAALVTSEKRLRALFQGIDDAVFVHDLDGKILDANPAASRRLGYTHEEFLSLNTRDVDDPAFAAGFGDRLGRQLAAGKLACEGRHRRKDGSTFPVDVSTAAITLEDRRVVLAVIRDATERKALEGMKAMLAQSERLASIGLLSAGVAHEINNPLAYIANNLAVLERDFAGIVALIAALQGPDAPDRPARVAAAAEALDWDYVRENLPRMLARTRDGVRRVAAIVHNLRGLARTSPPTLEPASVAELIASAVEMVQGRLRRNDVELVQRVDPLPKLSCVPSQVGQVVLNLLINAAQAVESVERPEGRRVSIRLKAEAGTQVIEVADNGPGIEPEAIPRLFDPFYTTKPVGEGTGLGLSISHGIVQGHGGRIEVDGAPGVGATFRVVLPCKPMGQGRVGSGSARHGAEETIAEDRGQRTEESLD